MLFPSLTFLIFAILFYGIWPWVNKRNQPRWIYLTCASFIFYGWWDWRFLFLIVLSGLIDFGAGIAMERSPSRKKTFLYLSLIGNLGSLAVFKYSEWFAEMFDLLPAALGWDFRLQNHIPEFALILPVGISFYTFQSMSYTIDIYRNKLKPTSSLFHFFAYLSLFPQLVAGPIIRARDLLGQLETHRPPSALRKWHGFRLIVTGLFQKMVLADNLGVVVNHGFKDPTHNPSTVYWWAVMTAFALQIYFDFSGYSQIARGLAKWMGLHFKMNFNHPYLADSLSNFWTRWHISLSQWFRDYVYIPLGGNRNGRLQMWRNLWLVMLVSGLWHGANITFVLWGATHALFLSLEKIAHPIFARTPKLIRHLLVLIQVIFAWVFFRAQSMEQALQVFHNLTVWSPIDMRPTAFFDSYFYLILAVLFEGIYAASLTWRPVRNLLTRPSVESLETGILIACCVFLRGPEQAFIYFQF
jgi:D-alanyl-lipoteichoic acid acyltransferase DltB (MBOAT superfamily)